MTERKTAAKTATSPRNGEIARELPTLRTPRHGRGRLLTGGVPGHAGGPGRPKNALRDLCRSQLDDVLPVLHARFLEGTLSDGDALRYAELLARFGLGTQQEQDVTLRPAAFTPEERSERVLSLYEKAEQRKRRQGGAA